MARAAPISGEAVDHQPDQCPIAQPRGRGDVYRIQNLSGLGRIQYRGLDPVDRTTHWRRGVGRNDLPIPDRATSLAAIDAAMQAFARSFAGMTQEPVPLADLETAREAIIAEMVAAMPEDHRRFLGSFKRGEPDWTLPGIVGGQNLPAVLWKQRN